MPRWSVPAGCRFHFVFTMPARYRNQSAKASRLCPLRCWYVRSSYRSQLLLVLRAWKLFFDRRRLNWCKLLSGLPAWHFRWFIIICQLHTVCQGFLCQRHRSGRLHSSIPGLLCWHHLSLFPNSVRHRILQHRLGHYYLHCVSCRQVCQYCWQCCL